MRETSLHSALKDLYSNIGDQQEAVVDGYVIDVVRADELVEIQTSGFSKLRSKLEVLLKSHVVRLVYPIARDRWITNLTAGGQALISRRKSPYRGSYLDLFSELIGFPGLVQNSNLRIDSLLIQEEQIWLADGRGSWRRKGRSIVDRRLLAILEQRTFYNVQDYLALLPPRLESSFTRRNLARALNIRISLAGKMAYCLNKMGAIKYTDREGRAFVYQVNIEDS